MIGVNRRVYEDGVFQGQLFDRRLPVVRLLNAFPQVTFPVSVLAQTSNQELVSHSWIFPNVVTNGHWWYSNIPAYIELDCRSRLQAVPATKQIGYYSDMYKLKSRSPSSACTGGSWRRCWLATLSLPAAGRKPGLSSWEGSCSAAMSSGFLGSRAEGLGGGETAKCSRCGRGIA